MNKSRFRPCIDLHEGKVKQIVGSTLSDGNNEAVTNFQSEKSSDFYSKLYSDHGLTGGHIIKLGPGNDEAAAAALSRYPGALQVGGGIDASNAEYWISKGASQVIVTSSIFKNGLLQNDNLDKIFRTLQKDKNKLVIDLSCKRFDNEYYVMTDRWQVKSNFQLNSKNLELLSNYCCEFLIHAVDVEGKKMGTDLALIKFLSGESPIKTVYAGGINSYQDIEDLDKVTGGKMDFTVGSALDIFGGNLRFERIAKMFD